MEYDENDENDEDAAYRQGYEAGLQKQLGNLSTDELLKLAENAKIEALVASLSPVDNYGTEYIDEDGEFRMEFSQPGSGSALRAASARNPRILPCPRCHRENMLTPADRAKHYVCDGCADARERGGWGYGEY